jgi:hypothetical protein
MKFSEKVLHVTAAAIIISFFMLMSAVVVDMPSDFVNSLLWVLVTEYVVMGVFTVNWMIDRIDVK